MRLVHIADWLKPHISDASWPPGAHCTMCVPLLFRVIRAPSRCWSSGIACLRVSWVTLLNRVTSKRLSAMRLHWPRAGSARRRGSKGCRLAFAPAWQPVLSGIDLGIGALMAENLRSGFTWEMFAREGLPWLWPKRVCIRKRGAVAWRCEDVYAAACLKSALEGRCRAIAPAMGTPFRYS